MTFNDIIAELSRLSVEERQILIRRALELDDPPLSAADEALVDERLAEHHADPSSSVPLDEIKKRLTELKDATSLRSGR
ncbi:MAG TPA: addiction module protein [Pyrinomonadaceae bacterium]|nr:addiction module protein [Pyrinomonadaceae bacterium]